MYTENFRIHAFHVVISKLSVLDTQSKVGVSVSMMRPYRIIINSHKMCYQYRSIYPDSVADKLHDSAGAGGHCD